MAPTRTGVVADSGTPGRIERVALTGGAPEVLALPGLAFNSMAMDATHLYWSEVVALGLFQYFPLSARRLRWPDSRNHSRDGR